MLYYEFHRLHAQCSGFIACVATAVVQLANWSDVTFVVSVKTHRHRHLIVPFAVCLAIAVFASLCWHGCSVVVVFVVLPSSSRYLLLLLLHDSGAGRGGNRRHLAGGAGHRHTGTGASVGVSATCWSNTYVRRGTATPAHLLCGRDKLRW